MITCWDLRDKLGKPSCCVSCHEDDDLGYDRLDREINGIEYYVCCRVAEWLEGAMRPI